MNHEAAYFRVRMAEEDQAARRANHRAAEMIHRSLSARYAARLIDELLAEHPTVISKEPEMAGKKGSSGGRSERKGAAAKGRVTTSQGGHQSHGVRIRAV